MIDDSLGIGRGAPWALSPDRNFHACRSTGETRLSSRMQALLVRPRTLLTSKLLVISAAWLLLVGCGPRNSASSFQGYLEAEYLYIASPLGGNLQQLHVARGQTVSASAALFALDPEPEASIARKAKEDMRQAEARLKDLQKGKRPTEMAAIEARLQQAKVALQLAELELQRLEKLRTDNVVSMDELDRARATRDLYRAQVNEALAQLETASLGGRSDEIQVAEASLQSAAASLAQAQWSVSQKQQVAPTNGVVHDTLYHAGEWVGPGRPVVVLLPPRNIKVRFFAPQAALPSLTPGKAVNVTLDGAPTSYRARISYVSTQAEFTPPVIYSQQTRAKLTFLVEATFEINDVSGLRPGQPADVSMVTTP